MKIIILITSILLLTGCYDNIELNQMYIITGIGIDYNNKEYHVSYEILNSNKEGSSINMDNNIISGNGKSINEAFLNVNRSLSKKPIFSHLKVVILKNNIEGKLLKEVFEYLLRNSDIRDEFNLVYTSSNIEDLFSIDTPNKVVSLEIFELLKNGNNNINPVINEPFEDILAKVISNKQDIILNNIIVSDNSIKVDGAYIFNKYNIKKLISNKDVYIYLLLNNLARNSSYNIKYKKGFLGISITDSNIKYKINNNKLIITGKINALLTNNTSDLDLTKSSSLKIINKKFNDIIRKDIQDFIKNLVYLDSDILGITKKYYKKTKIEDNLLWKYLDIVINIDITVNRKGLIFEV